MAAFVKPLIQVTYIIEGSSCCSLITYSAINLVKHWFEDYLHDLSFPCLDDVLQEATINLLQSGVYAPETPMQVVNGNVKASAHEMLRDCHVYFQKRFGELLAQDMDLYHLCQYFNSCHIKWNNVRLTDVEEKGKFRTLLSALHPNEYSPLHLNAIVMEIPTYLRLVNDMIHHHDEYPQIHDNPQVQDPLLRNVNRLQFEMVLSL